MISETKKPADQAAGQNKVQEYINRIKAGEPAEEIIKGLPESFRSGIEAGLKAEQEAAEEEAPFIPDKYKGLPADLIDDVWVITEYADAEITKREKERKARVLEYVREKEKQAEADEEQKTNDQERIQDLKVELGIAPPIYETPIQTPYSKFKMENGETDIGAFWYEYSNEKAKELKKSGELKWGEERIYFDVPFADLFRLRNVVMRVAAENSIPIAFKHLDVDKSSPAQKTKNDTRFVTNFASLEDAKRFYAVLESDAEYQAIVPDRQLDYHGIRLDELAEYASGYREGRGALERIMTAKDNGNGTYTYKTESGRDMTIDKAMYDKFKSQYDEMQAKQDKIRKEWGK